MIRIPKSEKVYPKPNVTVDIILIRRRLNVEIALIRRKHDPFKGKWALPGGYLNHGESPIEAAVRESFEETNVVFKRRPVLFETYGGMGRDPRGWSVTIVYFRGLDINESAKLKAGDDAKSLKWHKLQKNMKGLAFDHRYIIDEFINALNQGYIHTDLDLI